MSGRQSFKVDPGEGKPVKVTQNASDVKAGEERGDPSRISAYSGEKGIHTGADNPTTGRHGEAFKNKAKDS